MSGQLRKFKRSAARDQRPADSPAVHDSEIIDISHAMVTEAMVKALLPDGIRIEIADLQRLAYLVTHPMELDQVPPAQTKALGSKFNAALNDQFRAAQERRLKDTGKARP